MVTAPTTFRTRLERKACVAGQRGGRQEAGLERLDWTGLSFSFCPTVPQSRNTLQSEKPKRQTHDIHDPIPDSRPRRRNAHHTSLIHFPMPFSNTSFLRSLLTAHRTGPRRVSVSDDVEQDGFSLCFFLFLSPLCFQIAFSVTPMSLFLLFDGYTHRTTARAVNCTERPETRSIELYGC
ncbi:hypothetical protein IWZ00DRAFT_327037 [Phyllosticta capitalensis]